MNYEPSAASDAINNLQPAVNISCFPSPTERPRRSCLFAGEEPVSGRLIHFKSANRARNFASAETNKKTRKTVETFFALLASLSCAFWWRQLLVQWIKRFCCYIAISQNCKLVVTARVRVWVWILIDNARGLLINNGRVDKWYSRSSTSGINYATRVFHSLARPPTSTSRAWVYFRAFA